MGIAYARAREDGEDAIALECMEILDEAPRLYAIESGTRIDPADVANRKNRAEMRLKLLAKWNPKRWGEKIDVTSDNERLKSNIDDVAARAASLLERARKRKDETDGTD